MTGRAKETGGYGPDSRPGGGRAQSSVPTGLRAREVPASATVFSWLGAWQARRLQSSMPEASPSRLAVAGMLLLLHGLAGVARSAVGPGGGMQQAPHSPARIGYAKTTALM